MAWNRSYGACVLAGAAGTLSMAGERAVCMSAARVVSP